MTESETGKTWIIWVDCIMSKILIVIFHYSFTRCYYLRKLSKVYRSSLPITSYNPVWISKYLQLSIYNKIFSTTEKKNVSFIVSWICFFFFLCMAAPVVYWNSFTGGQIRAAAASLTTDTAKPDPSHICDLCRSLQHQILNPLSKARNQTCVLTDTVSGS